MKRDEAIARLEALLGNAEAAVSDGITNQRYGQGRIVALKDAIKVIAALESEKPLEAPAVLAVDAGPLWFDHLGFPHLLGQYITVPLRGEWVAGLDGGTQLGVTITERSHE